MNGCIVNVFEWDQRNSAFQDSAFQEEWEGTPGVDETRDFALP